MKILLIILLIASTFAAIENNDYFYNISSNVQYQVDTYKFPSLNIPKANLHFRVPVENLEEANNLQFQFYKGDKIDLKVKVSGFYQNPTNSEILNGTDNIELEQIEKYSLDNYIYYEYSVPTLKKQAKIKYLVFTILNNEPLHYLSVYVYSYKKPEYTIYNITYKKEEILNKTTLSKHKGVFIFQLENEELGKNKLVRLKVKKELPKEMEMGAAGLKERISTEKDLEKSPPEEMLKLKSQTKDGDYIIYEYPIQNTEVNNRKYLVIGLLNPGSLDFISLYVGPES